MKKNDQEKYNCGDVEKNVQAFLDNKLTKNELLLFQDHLNYCLPCDKKIEFEKKLKELIKIKASENSYPDKLKSELKKIIRGE
jgi:mycothiol system anti-sigma-R factor